MLDLLRRFADPECYERGIPRLSDLHLRVGEPARYRFDNELLPLDSAPPLTEDVLRDLLFPLLTREQTARLTARPPQDVDASFDWEEEGLSFRINAFHDRDGLACAIRALPRSVPKIEDIGFPSDRVWQTIVDLRQGLVIVTGITGSGKSTTLASLLHHVNQHRDVRIITLEDPIEYVIRSQRGMISQREVGRHIESFDAGLRSALREDPDVIMVGEMRDAETTALALSAAETGHLVLSTLHTKDTRGAITRIVDLFPSEYAREIETQLSFALSFVVGQKLVPRADSRGRCVAMEVLVNVPAIANLIRSGNLHQIYSVLQTQRKEGLSTLEQHLKTLAERGVITKRDAIRFANQPAGMTE
ncbi:MAG: PilT/PilU family type 4a pilus ATPase [Planctomycetes bacterium]|nr:PilT/PilU family type 4a pilus ATPase [Planctomycetota bacterium]